MRQVVRAAQTLLAHCPGPVVGVVAVTLEVKRRKNSAQTTRLPDPGSRASGAQPRVRHQGDRSLLTLMGWMGRTTWWWGGEIQKEWEE